MADMKDEIFKKIQQGAEEALAMERAYWRNVQEVSNAEKSEVVRFDDKGIIDSRELDKSGEFWILLDLNIPKNKQRAIKLIQTWQLIE